MNPNSILEQFNSIDEYWKPKVVGKVDNYFIKIAKGKGEFPWHKHKEQDEFFFIVKGSLTIRMKDKEVSIKEDDFYVVPKNKEHSPFAKEEVWFMLFESSKVRQFGDS